MPRVERSRLPVLPRHHDDQMNARSHSVQDKGNHNDRDRAEAAAFGAAICRDLPWPSGWPDLTLPPNAVIERSTSATASDCSAGVGRDVLGVQCLAIASRTTMPLHVVRGGTLRRRLCLLRRL